jgi:YidC/Oxa1 family membrane protein insertase
MGQLLSTLLEPLEIAVSYIMVAFYTLCTNIGMSPTSGWTWTISIIGLVIVIRILLIPLFVKQIKASRGLQLIQPEMKKIQEKYKGKTDQASRQAMTQETMALYKREGTNPFASCLPILLQSPIFFALFRVLNGIPHGKTVGALNAQLVSYADQATIFGAPLSDTFLHTDLLATKIVAGVLIILMSATTFTTQRQLMMKNMPASALDNPFAQQQKIILYALPVIFAVSGVNFPIGVLIYWLTTNLWSMGQQFYVIRRMPAPGSKAEIALHERRAAKKRRGAKDDEPAAPAGGVQDTPPSSDGATGQRQQPKRQSRSQRRRPQNVDGGRRPPGPAPGPAPRPRDSDTTPEGTAS